MTNSGTKIVAKAKELSTPDAVRFAEFTLIEADLESVEACLRIRAERRKLYNPSDDEQWLCLALFRDAVVQFIACFDKGRNNLRFEDVYNGDLRLRGAHEYFEWLKNIRVTFAAHRFGSLRGAKTGLLLDPQTGRPIGTTTIINMFFGPEEEGDADLLRFVNIAREYVKRELERLSETLLRAMQQWPQEDIDALPDLEVRLMEGDDRWNSRGQVRTNNVRPRHRQIEK